MVLEYDRAVRPGLVDLAVFQQHAAGSRIGKTGDDVEQSRLAATRMADDGDIFTLINRKLDILQNDGAFASRA